MQQSSKNLFNSQIQRVSRETISTKGLLHVSRETFCLRHTSPQSIVLQIKPTAPLYVSRETTRQAEQGGCEESLCLGQARFLRIKLQIRANKDTFHVKHVKYRISRRTMRLSHAKHAAGYHSPSFVLRVRCEISASVAEPRACFT